MELPILRSPVKVRNKKKRESEGQKIFDDTRVQLRDVHLQIYLFMIFSFAN